MGINYTNITEVTAAFPHETNGDSLVLTLNSMHFKWMNEMSLNMITDSSGHIWQLTALRCLTGNVDALNTTM